MNMIDKSNKYDLEIYYIYGLRLLKIALNF